MDAQESLNSLKNGNFRFVHGHPQHPRQQSDRREAVLSGQNPIAAILSCSDSRVPPEILFDQGIGDLFVIRTAGNVADDGVLGSLEYAVEHLRVGLVVVMGHSRCGAVTAAVQGEASAGHITSLIDKIAPAVEIGRARGGDLLAQAVDANIELTVEGIRNSEPILVDCVTQGKLTVIGARYDLDSGQVVFLG
ncbi:MAG TPA: carbonic anhydrase [Anaerolineaceae bacterium]|jgi:carbonic anhydrase